METYFGTSVVESYDERMRSDPLFRHSFSPLRFTRSRKRWFTILMAIFFGFIFFFGHYGFMPILGLIDLVSRFIPFAQFREIGTIPEGPEGYFKVAICSLFFAFLLSWPANLLKDKETAERTSR